MSLSSIPARFSAARTRSMLAAFSSIAAVAVGCRVCTPAEIIARSGTRVTSPVALMSSRVPVKTGTAATACWAGTLAGIASLAGFRGLPGSGAYSASKAAAIGYLESLRVELRGSGIAVVTICPGYIATPMTAGNPYPMPFLMRPDAAARDIARAIARRSRFHMLPWPMAIVGRVFRALPRPLYDRMFEHAPVKPRRPD